MPYTAPSAGFRISIPAEHLSEAIRDAIKRDTVDVHDPALVASTPGAADLLAELERLKAEAGEASRAVARHGGENVREWHHPNTSAGRLDELNAEKAALTAAASALGAEAARVRRALWEALYVVDADTLAARRKAAAVEADAQHARAVQALADLHDALERRERAYVTAGHPGDRAHWSSRRPTAMGNVDPSQVFSEPFRALDAIVSTFPGVADALAGAEEVTR